MRTYRLNKNAPFDPEIPDTWPIQGHCAWFNKQFGEGIKRNKMYQYELWKERKAKLKNENQDGDNADDSWIKNLKLPKEDVWLNEKEEADHFIERYIQDIRATSEQQQRCEQWVKNIFREHLLLTFEQSYLFYIFILIFMGSAHMCLIFLSFSSDGFYRLFRLGLGLWFG